MRQTLGRQVGDGELEADDVTGTSNDRQEQRLLQLWLHSYVTMKPTQNSLGYSSGALKP
jgi:hypothetical protein